MYLQMWLLFLWALSFTDVICGILDDEHIVNDSRENLPHRVNDKLISIDYPPVPESSNYNNIFSDDRGRFSNRCSDRLERALGHIRERQATKRKNFHLDGYSLHQQLRSAPFDMYVTDMNVRLPSTTSWVKVDKCRFHPKNSSLETRLSFNDLTISGKVNLFNDDDLQRGFDNREHDDSCNMILRLRRAGIWFHTEPIRRERGHVNVRTDSHFVEPGFISVYAYGCEPKLREHKRNYQENDELSKEMEDIFLKGIRSLLTSYLQKELQPAIKETLMRNMGYTLSYG
ncbi:uncharacterized protein [Leptinotarsa decemlineata]|uniref:uncharacterized protein n=1 Tax=Leptinotarsa decemlineata TaxID=7539 RepID=UPI003D308A61